MTKITILLFLFITVRCASQNSDFQNYLQDFKLYDLPLTISTENYGDLFYPSGENHEIPNLWVREFICYGQMDCDLDPSLSRYDYGIRVNLDQDYHTVLVHKQNFEGETVEDFDLSETIALTYDQNGRLLTYQSVSKDNDSWISEIEITEEGVLRVSQGRIIESGKPIMNCEIEEREYVISDFGEILLSKTGPVRLGRVYWDDTIEKLIMTNE